MTWLLILAGSWVLLYAMACRMDRYKARNTMSSRYFSGGWPSGGDNGYDRGNGHR
jgi:hypothetical protein